MCCHLVGCGTANQTRSAMQSATRSFYSRSHDAVIRVYDEAGNVIQTYEHKGEFPKNRENCLDLSGERIDYSVHGSSCALHYAVPDILGCLRSALRDVGCRVDGARLNAAHRDGDGENDR